MFDNYCSSLASGVCQRARWPLVHCRWLLLAVQEAGCGSLAQLLQENNCVVRRQPAYCSRSSSKLRRLLGGSPPLPAPRSSAPPWPSCWPSAPTPCSPPPAPGHFPLPVRQPGGLPPTASLPGWGAVAGGELSGGPAGAVQAAGGGGQGQGGVGGAGQSCDSGPPLQGAVCRSRIWLQGAAGRPGPVWTPAWPVPGAWQEPGSQICAVSSHICLTLGKVYLYYRYRLLSS